MKLSFFTNISHEIRTPLTMILAPLELILKKGEGTKKQFQYMYRNSQKLLHLINQLLDFRKLESGNLKIDLARGDIIGFIKNIYSNFTPYAKLKQIKYLFNSSGVNAFIFSSPNARFLLLNLLMHKKDKSPYLIHLK